MTKEITPADIKSLIEGVLMRLGNQRDFADLEIARCQKARELGTLAGVYGSREALAAAMRHLVVESKSLTTLEGVQQLASQFEANAAEASQAVEVALQSYRFGDAAGHEGVSMGWLAAKRVLDQCIQALSQIR